MFFKKTGIMGINARNLLYLKPFNQEKAIKIADDKLKTKAFLSARGINVPKLYATIKNSTELAKFNFDKIPSSFALKPNLGYGGEGIIPVVSRQKDLFISSDQKQINLEQIKNHIKEILNGTFAITHINDIAFFEQLIISDARLKQYAYQGLPDIRVIVHNLIPIMAMLRLPTMESKGKANLHQGAIGAGIDLAKGEITTVIYKNKIIKDIPDIGSIKGFKIPYWDEILQIACKCQLATNLGYLAADIAIDRQSGPILLEINARAGLSIQLANLAPLRSRLEKVEEVKVKNVSKGIRIAKDMFGYTVEKNVKTLTGKKVIGLYENIEIIQKEKITKVIAFMNTTRKKSSISIDLAHELGLSESKKINKNEEKYVRLKLNLDGKKIKTILKIEKLKKKKYQLIIGTRDIIDHFLIDPSLSRVEIDSSIPKKNINTIFNAKFDPIESDAKICFIDKKVKYISFLKPLNFKEEFDKFLKNHKYNPQLIYPEIKPEFLELKKELKKIKCDYSPIGLLFEEKIDELQDFIALILARGSNEFTDISKKIFGFPDKKDFENLENELKNDSNSNTNEQKTINDQELKKIFEEELKSYNLSNWKVLISDKLLANCGIHKNRKIFIKKGSSFSEKRAKSLILHEIETHILTAENGLKQKYKLFQRGFANYLVTQEGLALYNSEYYHPYQDEEQKNKTALVEAILFALENPFNIVFEKLREKNLTVENALKMTFRAKRGIADTSKVGAFTKDYIYHKGKADIVNFVNTGGDLKDLYLGKYNLKDLSKIKQIADPELAPIIPKWLK